MTTAGKLQKFLNQHRPSSPKSGRTSPGNAAAPTSDKLQPHKLATAADALIHFCNHGLDATPKLLHCIPATAAPAPASTVASSTSAQQQDQTQAAAVPAPLKGYGPYDLQVVVRSQLPANYFTVSAIGVVEVHADGTPSMQTRVGEWVRHSSMYQMFSRLSVGQDLWKVYVLRRWHRNAQKLRFQQRRQQLSQELLQLKPAYLKVLTECRTKLASVHAAGALQAMESGVFRLEALTAQQQEYQQTKLGPLLARTVSGIITDVEQMAQRLQSSEKLLAREVAEYKKDPSAGAMQGLCPIKIQAERAAVIAKHAAALNDLHRLPAFLRLLALTVMQSHLDLLVGAVSGLKAHLQAPGNALQVDMLLQGPSGISLSPALEETLKGFSKGIVEHLVGVLTACPRFLNHPSIADLLVDPVNTAIASRSNLTSCSKARSSSCMAASAADLKVFSGLRISSAVVLTGHPTTQQAGARQAVSTGGTGGPASAVLLPSWLTGGEEDGQNREGGQLLMMVVGDRVLQHMRKTLDQHVMRSYREAQQVADALSDLHVLQKFACMWDPLAYKARRHTVASLRKDALFIRELQAQLQVALDSQSVGLLQLETGALKSTYSNTLASAHASIAMLLVVAARRAAEATIARLQAVSKELNQAPSKLPEFITFRHAAKAINQTREELLVMLPGQVNDLYGIVTGWGFRLPHTDQVLLEDVKEACHTFSTALTAAMAFLDSRQLGMVALLDRQGKEVQRQVQDLLKRLESAAMTHRLGVAAAASGSPGGTSQQAAAGMLQAEALAAWQLELEQLSVATGTINHQEEQLGMKHTLYEDLDEAERVLQELQQDATAHAATSAETSAQQ